MMMARRRRKKPTKSPVKLNSDIRIVQYDSDPGVEAILREQNIDLTSEVLDVDIELIADENPQVPETPVDFNISREIVPLNDTTVVRTETASRDLVKMNDLELKNNDWLLDHRIVTPHMEDYAMINSFREIRTRLLQISQGKNFICMIVSLNRDMGTTFTTANLGAAFSYEGAKTSLLVDCDPRERKLSALLGLKNYTGLSNYIVDDEIEATDIIYPVGISRMRLIPFGTADKSRLEFIGSTRLKEFFYLLKRRHIDRYIFLNAPPIELSADAAILSELADYVVVVVPYGKITRRRLARAIKSIPAEKIAGFVLNNCKKYV